MPGEGGTTQGGGATQGGGTAQGGDTEEGGAAEGEGQQESVGGDGNGGKENLASPGTKKAGEGGRRVKRSLSEQEFGAVFEQFMDHLDTLAVSDSIRKSMLENFLARTMPGYESLTG